MNIIYVLLAFVTLQRLLELVLARRNTKRLLARGGYEKEARHYPAIVALHTAWLIGLWWYAGSASLNPIWLAAFLVLQLLRIWVLWTLGDRWTTRIIVVPGEPKVRHGPYRFINHPNYAIVIGEIAILPLALGLTAYAVIFSVLNGALLWIRVTAENRALEENEPTLQV